MSKIKICKNVCILIAMVIGLCGCAQNTSDSSAKGIAQQATKSEVSANVSTKVIGQVTEIYGNYLMLQLAESGWNGIGSVHEGMMGEGKPMGENMPDRASEDGMMSNRKQMGENMPNREEKEGMHSRENMPDKSNREGMKGEGMPSGVIGSDIDLAESIELSDEIKEYSIPVNTPVYQYGIEMTFSQITAEMYITILFDENENIVEINLLN